MLARAADSSNEKAFDSGLLRVLPLHTYANRSTRLFPRARGSKRVESCSGAASAFDVAESGRAVCRGCANAEPSRGLSAVTLALPSVMPLSASTSRKRGKAASMASRTSLCGEVNMALVCASSVESRMRSGPRSGGFKCSSAACCFSPAIQTIFWAHSEFQSGVPMGASIRFGDEGTECVGWGGCTPWEWGSGRLFTAASRCSAIASRERH